ncbi:C-type lectin domain family 3 member A [Amphibalanus amphitrite]|uniref:C-type lectin domain family 3 member A n=1 Tax=Amphibalanus amphitrite TaxID=1232801 RepID=A0A6A4WUC6_AMPAM|nr:C-type lectin domain family 3 member A [Amphibalanus amphitrite]
MPLLWLLLLFCGQQVSAASAVPAERVLQSTNVYSFDALPADSGSLSASVPVTQLAGLGDCQCRARCLSQSTCRGYGHSVSTSSCLLTELLPTPERMEPGTADWRWYARRGVRLLGEPCAADRDCSLLVTGATCFNSTCGCHGPVEEDGSGGCRKAGRFIAVGTGQLTGQPLWEQSGASVNECSAVCAANRTCLAFDLMSDGTCTFYSEGITSGAGSGRDVQSFVWSFRQPDGNPPQSYVPWDGGFLNVLPATTGLQAAGACFSDGAILYPNMAPEKLANLRTFFADHPASSDLVLVGMEDMVREGVFVTSDGREVTDLAWDAGEPNGGGGENCTVITQAGLLHDAPCTTAQYSALCQYVGENLAVGRHAWMNTPSTPQSPANGADGDVETFVDNKHDLAVRPLTWTVDLGAPVQVTSVLYASRADCCPMRNRFLEIRVGSHPTLFDEQNSVRCVSLHKHFMLQAYARMFRCETPVTGRYVRVARHRRRVFQFGELAVFGNRLATIGA